MNLDTLIKLNSLNKKFYDNVAADFDDSRKYDWEGWSKLLPILNKNSGLNVLDIGCGNGRFAAFLDKNDLTVHKYLGLDSSDELLSIAKKNNNLSFKTDFAEKDIIESLISEQDVVIENFDLITLFGVMHHIPSSQIRTNLIQQLAKHLKTGGLLILTFWQFMEFERFQKKVISSNLVGIDQKDLEENDYILDWKRGGIGYRYCHYYSKEEIESLIHNSNLKLTQKFRADGKEGNVNQYILLERV